MNQGTCPTLEGIPVGWHVWRGPVPGALGTFAVNELHSALKNPNGYPYGTIVAETPWAGMTVGAYAQHHPWTTRGAKIIYGCYKGITLIVKNPPGAVREQDSIAVPDREAALFTEPVVDWGTVAWSSGAGLLGAALLVVLISKFRR